MRCLPVTARLRLSGAALIAGNTFTQADIDAGLVTYDHDGSETLADSFAFNVDDGAGAATAGGFAITVTPVNDEQVVTTNTGTTVAEASTGTVITTAMLETTDADNTPVQLVYTLSAVPGNGTLRLSGAALIVGNTFTPRPTSTRALVTYDHDGSETLADSFAFNVDDGAGAATAGGFAITVTPVNDEQVLAYEHRTDHGERKRATGTVIATTAISVADHR